MTLPQNRGELVGPNGHPSRPLVISNGRVLSMDSNLHVADGADVVVRDGVIELVGDASAANLGPVDRIDASGHIVMPGLIDTHTHLWNGIWRSYVGTDGDRSDYEALGVRLGPLFTPEDSYHAVLSASLEMINFGVTTVHNWAHNMLTPAHADAELQAMADVGIRSRFSYGYHWNLPSEEPMNLSDVVRVRDKWSSSMTSVGIALRNDKTPDPDSKMFPTLSVPREVLQEEMSFARANGLSLTTHLVMMGPAGYWIDSGYIGPDNLIVHGYTWTPEDWHQLAQAGLIMSISPYSAMKSWGMLAPLGDMLAAGIPTGLSFDTMGGPGRADMFRLMQLLAIGEKLRIGTELPSYQALELATLGGASVLGLADHVGSITPGKRADIIVLRTDDPSIAATRDLASAVVNSAGPDLVRDVIVDGQILKRNGTLTGFDPRAVAHDVTAAFSNLHNRYLRQ